MREYLVALVGYVSVKVALIVHFKGGIHVA